MEGNKRVFIGTVGYFNLRDYSIGPKLLPELKAMDWPPGIDVDELNWGPIAVVQHFQALATPYQRVVILTARTANRKPGTVTLRRWSDGLPDAENIQARVSEAVTGVISVDNLLIIGEHFKIWPDEVYIVDVEPGVEEMGDHFTPEVRAAVPQVLALVRQAALEDSHSLPQWEMLNGNELLIV